jgi:ectoine hydroxylase-related dioxygenase (phytanoyl-CoA dioxygenase family)
MALTDEERFRFDLNGYLVRPAILTAEEIAEIRDQIYRIRYDNTSLPPAHRQVPSGPSSLLIDHPKVIDVLHEIIAEDIRIENSYCAWREKGEQHGEFHGGGPRQNDPIFGYRCHDGRIFAGMVRVIFELTEIDEARGGGTWFIPGSHKANFPMHPDHLSLEPDKRSGFARSYSCPAGSAVFFTENSCHAGPIWERDDPRVIVLNAYSHIATHWHRLTIAPEVIAGLPREKQAYFREPWVADFSVEPTRKNTPERYINSDIPPIDTDLKN